MSAEQRAPVLQAGLHVRLPLRLRPLLQQQLRWLHSQRLSGLLMPALAPLPLLLS